MIKDKVVRNLVQISSFVGRYLTFFHPADKSSDSVKHEINLNSFKNLLHTSDKTQPISYRHQLVDDW